MIRSASARWTGNVKQGSGTISTETGVMKDQAYSFNARVENAKGTNPEELVGAAHAGCFSMQFAGLLSEAGFPPEEIKTSAEVQLDVSAKGLHIAKIDLFTTARVKDISDAKLQEIGQKAKATCPVSQLFTGAPITLRLTRG